MKKDKNKKSFISKVLGKDEVESESNHQEERVRNQAEETKEILTQSPQSPESPSQQDGSPEPQSIPQPGVIVNYIPQVYEARLLHAFQVENKGTIPLNYHFLDVTIEGDFVRLQRYPDVIVPMSNVLSLKKKE